MAGWSSLPADLVNRVADHLLAADDLDYYMALRAVCHDWRSATADPKAIPRRFLPRQWAMLDEVYQTDARLFVNTVTGRFVRKDLSLLVEYFVVAGAAGGAVVLAERAAPHAARVLNPFTGSFLRFEAPVPDSETLVSAHMNGSSPPTLVLLCDKSGTIYWADPNRESFVECKELHYSHPLIKLALLGAIHTAAREDQDGSVVWSLLQTTAARKIVTLAAKPVADYFSSAEGVVDNRCFLVESAGEMLIVFKLPNRIEVFKVDTQSNLLEPVKDIGSRALFVGDCRCLSVDADKFPSVEANCIYYVVDDESLYDICIYNLEDGKEVLAGGAIGSFNPFTFPEDSAPFTVVQLLCSYTFEVQNLELRWEKILDTMFALDL